MTIILDDELSSWLAQEAKRRGRKVDEVAALLLRASMRRIPPDAHDLRSVMDFAGIGAGRHGALGGKDAQKHIDELRTEWDDRERQWDR